MEPLDFLAIGDTTTDIFIRLKDAQVHCDLNHEECTICMRWGDKIPFEFAKTVHGVGNSANAAVSAARLNVKAGLLTWIGNDVNGKGCLDDFTSNNVDTSYVVTVPDIESNQHYVLWYENERTILVKQNPFPYALPNNLLPPRYVYLSSLGNSEPFHHEVMAWVVAHPETKVIFQPGTFQISMGVEALKGLYDHTELFVVNKEESERILNLNADQEIKTLLTGLRELGPTIVCITDGTNGAYAFDGSQMLFVPMYPDQKSPYERTGSGDAFASSVAAALALGKPLDEALLWGPVNAMSVVQKIGAQEGLLTREQLEKYLADAPPEFNVQPL